MPITQEMLNTHLLDKQQIQYRIRVLGYQQKYQCAALRLPLQCWELCRHAEQKHMVKIIVFRSAHLPDTSHYSFHNTSLYKIYLVQFIFSTIWNVCVINPYISCVFTHLQRAQWLASLFVLLASFQICLGLWYRSSIVKHLILDSAGQSDWLPSFRPG